MQLRCVDKERKFPIKRMRDLKKKNRYVQENLSRGPFVPLRVMDKVANSFEVMFQNEADIANKVKIIGYEVGLGYRS